MVEVPDLIPGKQVFLKLENEQPMGAFKIRGAFNAISRLPESDRRAGVITYSSGNHGQAVAYAARELGCRAVVVMPDHAPSIKVEGVKGFGGEVLFGGPTSRTRRERAEAVAAQEGLTIVPPFDHPDIMAGQATCTLEIVDQCPGIATLVVPVGGGGLLAGACIVTAALKPEIRVVAVEPSGAAKLQAALAAGRPVTLQNARSLADGLLPLAVGDLTFPIIQPVVEKAVLVEDDQIAQAVRRLHQAGIRTEPSGAATSAAIMAGLVESEGPMVAIVSGGNVDDSLYQELVS